MAYIKAQPVTDFDPGRFDLLPIGWLRMVRNDIEPANPALIDYTDTRPNPVTERGRYLAESMCTECHGPKGVQRAPLAPDLGIARAFSREDFGVLLRTGIGLGGREVNGLMSQAAQKRYRYLADADVDALYEYLQEQ